ncbi:MFS transporter [Paenibacillus sp. alder61]|uniref:MFS transporter n=1 Tax=Paenibacillus TaxID=44249 RepID=UPI00147921BF|nr:MULTISPECIES: MFS transporter [Paenibacillus]MCA1295779.1 MFS transporter [Paenibacillus sp. alder61]
MKGQKHAYYGLLSTVTLSGFGDAFGLLSMEWLVYEITGSKLAMGALALSSGIPELILRLLGSPLSDRWPRSRLMAALAALRLTAVVLPLIAGLIGQLQLWHLFLAAGLSGSCSALYLPTAMALVPDAADSRKLTRAFAVIDGCRNAVTLIGPAMAGAVVAGVGSLPALGVNALCYIAAIIMLLFLPKTFRPGKTSSSPSIAAYLREIGEGFIFYRKFPAMLAIMGMVSISNMCSVAIWTMMVPYVSEVLHRDAEAMGTLTAATALGTLTGLGLISILGEIKQRRTVMISSLAAMGFFNMILGLVYSYTIALAALFAVGVSGPFFGALSSSLHGKLVPGHLQGRVNAIRFLIGGSLQPVGAFVGSAVADRYGVQMLFLVAGIIPILSSFAGLFFSNLKTLNGDLSEIEARSQKKYALGDGKGQVPFDK